MIMDGVGIGRRDEANAVYMADTPNLDRLFASKLYTRLLAHGTAVGLPTDQDMGNSEVGHNALGAGRIFDQGARLVDRAIESGGIFNTEVWSAIVGRAKGGGTVHFIGLLSDGNVHSHIRHLYRLIDECADLGLPRLRVHALLDGRDVGQRTALEYVVPTENKLKDISEQKGLDYGVASGGGRMNVTMDRYNADWRIVKRGWEAHVLGIGRPFPGAAEAIRTYYEEDPDITDQYLDAFVVAGPDGTPVGPIVDGDAVVFFNFRGDRADRDLPRVHRDGFSGIRPGAPSGRLFRGHDGIRRRHASPPPLPGASSGHRSHRQRISLRRRRQEFCRLGDPEVRPRDLFLERESFRVH